MSRDTGGESGEREADVVVRLQPSLRDAFKTPLGPIYTDTESLVADAGRPLVAVGDVVTAHLLRAGHRPAVAVVDGRTERGETDEWVTETLPPAAERTHVVNPPGALAAETLTALREAIDRADGTTIGVEGEEDLVALPAILAAPAGATVVYGQPGEGMVAVAVTPDATSEARRLLERMDGDSARALSLLGVE